MCQKTEVDKVTRAWCGISPLKELFRGVLATSKTIHAIIIAMGYPPKLDVKTLLMKRHHTVWSQDIKKLSWY